MANDTRRIFDVDIDLPSTVDKNSMGYVRAMIYNEKTEKISPHPSGFYVEKVPVDTITGLCSFDYEYSDERGFMKVDLLTNRVYDVFKTKQAILEAIDEDNVDWDLFQDPKVVEKLPHIGKHFDIVKQVHPRTVEDLADILALIRPAKISMLESYLKHKEATRRRLYIRPKSGIYFKKSHAISYALMIVCSITSIDGGIKW